MGQQSYTCTFSKSQSLKPSNPECRSYPNPLELLRRFQCPANPQALNPPYVDSIPPIPPKSPQPTTIKSFANILADSTTNPFSPAPPPIVLVGKILVELRPDLLKATKSCLNYAALGKFFRKRPSFKWVEATVKSD